MRILFPGAGILVASAWCLGVLNSHRRFLLAYLARLAWNTAMIGTLLIFGGRRDPDSAPSPNKFCRRLGMRNAALKASTAMLFCPNSRATSHPQQSGEAADEDADPHRVGGP